MNLAPIGLSTYSRLPQLKQTIEALKANTLAEGTDLYIFSDAAKTGDEEKVAAIREYIGTINGFNNVHVIKRTKNSRIQNNRDGISQLLEKYGKCIYLEEDIVTAPGFLKFMNEALNIYEKEETIFSISGYSPPINIPADYFSDIFILRRACAWGMGIWYDRFKKISYLDKAAVLRKFSNRKEVEELTKYGEDLLNMILLDAAGEMDALDVKIFYHQFLNEKYTIYPRKSLVRNIGHDGSGVHCVKTNRFDVDLWDKVDFEISGHVKLDDRIVKSNYEFRKIRRNQNVVRNSNLSIQKNRSEPDTVGQNIIFLISQPRAGSTLLQRILSGHPDIHTIAEPWIMLYPLYALKNSGLLAEFDSNLARQGLDDFISQVPEGLELYFNALRNMGTTLYNRALEVSGKRLFLDKTPRYYLIIPELKKVFPEAKFIILLRDPLAVLSSTLKTWFQNNLESFKKSPNYSDIVRGPSYLIHGIQYLTGSAIVVKYEELARSPENCVKSICKQLGISFHDEMLTYGDRPRPKGRFGDPVGIYQHLRPVSDNIDKWTENISSPELVRFADQYLESLGSDIVTKLGYNFPELKQKLDLQKQICSKLQKNFEKIRIPKADNERNVNSNKIDENEKALELYIKRLRKNPEDLEALLALGLISIDLAKYDDSFVFCQKALEIVPKNINVRDIFLKLGEKIELSGAINKAREIYLYYLIRNPEEDQISKNWEKLKDTEKDKQIIKKVKAKKKDYIVSAIVSTYNSVEFIRECLENLESQTISKDLEIVIIDAASPQNEEQIVKEYQKRYSNITYIKTNGRIGIYTAWNIALKEASGKYCISASTNDILDQEACEVLARYLDENPECMLVYGDTYLTRTPHETFEKNTHTETYRWPPYSFQDHLNSCLVGPHPMWRKQVHSQIGFFDERYIADGDQEFWLRIGENHPIAHIPFFTGLQWISDDAISRKGPLPHLEVMHIQSVYKKRFSVRSEKKNSACTIIIPVFNQLEYTKQCIEGLYKNTPTSLFEIIVVNNNSSDGTLEFLSELRRNIKIVSNPENFGFAKACNQGARLASGRYLIFLNNDTVPLPGWLEEMIDSADSDADVGIVGSRLLYPDGKIQHAGIEFINGMPDHPFRNLPGDHPEANENKELDMVTGACLLVKRDLFFECGGFDEQFKNGVEDIDLCLKVRSKGFKVLYNPKSTLYHYEGRTPGRFDHVKENLQTFFSRWRDYFDDHGKFIDKAVNQKILIKWEGSQFVNHSLALVNRELCIELAKRQDIELSLIPYEPHEFGPEEDPERFGLIEERLQKPLLGKADFYVRHQWPPNFTPPAEGHWIIIQPWEFGALPKDWVEPMETMVDEMWVPSNYVRDVYINSGISASRIFVVPNGVNYEQFNPAISGYKLDTQKRFKFLFVGGTIGRKGIDILLGAYTEAFTREDDVCLVIKDMGGESFYRGQNAARMIEDIKKDPSAPEVLYLTETLKQEEIAGLYTACDCLVHPYRGEGFGLPVAEAMACGLPAIVTKGGACDDFCSEENAYLINSTVRPVHLNNCELSAPAWLLEPDQSQLVEMLKFVCQYPDKARAKGAIAARQIRKKVDWKMSTNLIMERLKALKDKPIRRLAGSVNHQIDRAMKSPQEIYQTIQQSMKNMTPEQLIHELELLAESYPQFSMAYNDLGVLHYQTGKKEKARQFYEKAVKLDPGNMVFLKNLADFYCIESGRVEDALQIYVRILQAAPQDVEALMATGLICKALEKSDDARNFFRRILEIEPQNLDARQQLSEMESQSSAADLSLEPAENAYRRLQEKLNTLTPAEAIVEFKKLIELYPDFAAGHNDIGVLYYQTGDKEKAWRHYQQATRLQPDNMTLQKNLADFLFVELGKMEEALQIYMNVLRVNWDDVETLLITGHICVALKKFNDAQGFYQRVLELEPGNQDAGANLEALVNRQSGGAPAHTDSLSDETVLSVKNQTVGLDTEEYEDRHVDHQTTASIIISLDGIQNRVKECLKSIQAHTAGPHELLLLEAGATKSMLKWSQQLAKENGRYRIIECAGQMGRAESVNRAIQEAGGEMIVLMHNDVAVPDGWLKAIKMCFRLDPNIGVVGPISNRAAGIQQLAHSDESERIEFESAAKRFREQYQFKRVATQKLSDFCLAFRRELIDKIGYFDARFASEELMVEDFCNRATSEGYQNLIAADTYVFHYDQHKAKKTASVKNTAGSEDLKRYKEKWNSTQNSETKAFQTALLLEKADGLSQKGQIDQAVEILINAIGIQPEEKRLYFKLAGILVAVKRFQDAKDTLNEMPSENGNPELEKVLLLGYAEEGLEDYDAASACAEKVLAINAGHARALNLKGILAYRSNDRNSAEKYFNQAIASDPGYGEPYTNLGMLHLEAEHAEEALEFFEKGFILSPTDLDIATNYHAFIEGLGRFDSAENVARQAAALYPNNQKIKYMLIDFLVRQGNYEVAMPEIEDAIIKFGIEDGILNAALKVREKLGPMTIKKSLKKASVSLCMIIKDEEKYLARCLASAKPIVDEMIVVDTGSADRSKDIAVTFGAQVYDYEWKNDFAAARNFSISRASGEWIFILDGDEVISPLDYDHFKKIVTKKLKAPVAYSITTRNYSKVPNIVGWVPNDGKYPDEEETLGWLPSEKVRLFYGKDQIRFEGAVHEMVDPVLKRNGIEIKKCGIPVHHYGRLDQEKLVRKGETYFDIGQKKLSELGEDVRALWELAIQATVLEKNQQALELWQRLLALNPNPKLAANAYVNLGNIYNRLGTFEDALIAGKKAVECDPDLKEAQYNLALAELQCGDAFSTIRILENLLDRFPDYPPAQFILSAAFCCVGQKENGVAGIQKLKDTPLGAHLEMPCLDLAQSLISARKIESALLVLGAAIECDIVSKEILDLFTECMQINDKAQKLSEIPPTGLTNRHAIKFENLPQ